MMNENQFWDLIADAKADVGNFKKIPDWLEQKLLEFPLEETLGTQPWPPNVAELSVENGVTYWPLAKVKAFKGEPVIPQ